jgi:Leucine-rich repeat (LRR) protein
MSDLDVIKEIEKIIGEELKPCPPDADIMSYEQRRTYLLKEQQVIGLNIGGCNLISYDFLKDLPNLILLYLSSNQIKDISFLKDFSKLTRLRLSDNKISDISVLKALSNLIELSLWGNQIRDLPEWLLNLNIPIRLDLGSENGIFLANNPIEKPPIEIIEQGNEAIRAYFEQLRKEGSDMIYEAKLILVGEGGAGKTSLANKIRLYMDS